MFLRRASLRPLAGKGPALRDLLVSRQRTGRWNITQPLAGPSVEFRMQVFYESLRDMQQAIEAVPTQQPGPELSSLAAAAPALELDEVLAPPPDGQWNYISRLTCEYAPGKLRETRSLLEEIIQHRTANGGSSALLMRVSGGAPALMVAGFYHELAELEATRAKALADPAGAERLQRLAPLLARPNNLPELLRIVARST